MRAHTPGLTLEYQLLARDAESIVLLPALGTTVDMWRPQIESLCDTYELILPETGGHNAWITRGGSITLAELAAGVLAVIDAVGLERVHVIGLSMGGMIAQELAIAHPDRVLSLVLASTVSRYSDDAREGLRQRAETVEEQGMEAIVGTTMQRWFTQEFRAQSAESVDWIAGMVRSADTAAYATAARAVAEVDTYERLSQIECPSLVIRGQADPGVAEGAAAELLDHIEGARLLQIDGAHLCNVENAVEFNRAIGDFFEALVQSREDESTDIRSPW